MYSKTYRCGNTLDEVWAEFHQDPVAAQRKIVEPLLKEGYSPLAICYAASLAREKLLGFVGDSRFAGIMINEVRKHAYKKNDQRWKRSQ